MRFAPAADAGPWLHRCGCAVLLATMWACDADSPVSPSSPPAGSTPTHPSAPPAVPGSSKLTLSRPDIVFNAMTGATSIDTAAVSVEATAGSVVTDLHAVTTYTTGQPDGWLTAELDRATLPAKLTLRARTTPLQAGEYTAIVRLRAPGAAVESLTVTTRVVTGANIGLNAAKICFTTSFGDATPRRDDVRVTSVDGSVIDGLSAAIVYDAGQPTGWLETSFDVTTAPARLWLRGTPGTLPVGTYSATVQVSSAKAGNSPVPIRVTLTVNASGPPPPSQRSTLNVHVRWETAINDGGGTVLGTTDDGATYSIYCQGGAEGCTGILESGVGEILLGAQGFNGGVFSHWEGACAVMPGSSSCPVRFETPGTTLDATAVFRTAGSPFGIGLPGTGTGSVTTSLGYLTCAFSSNLNFPFCTGGIDEGVGTFTLTATPDAGSVFAGWQLTALGAWPGQDVIGSCYGTASTCRLTFTRGGTTVGGFATFVAASATGDRMSVLPVTLGVILPASQGIAIPQNYVLGPDGQVRNGMPPASGTVTGPGIDCRITNGAVSGDCEERVPPGTTVQLMRHPAPGTYCTATPETEQPGDCASTLTSTQGDIVVSAEFFTKLNSIRLHMAGSGTGSAGGPEIHCFLVDGVESEISPIPPGEPGRCYFGRVGVGSQVFRSEQMYGPGTFVRWSGDCDANSGYPADYCVVTFTGSGKEANIVATYTR
jgi:hypothetical protein